MEGIRRESRGEAQRRYNAVATPLATRAQLMDLQSTNYISDRAYAGGWGKKRERDERERTRDQERDTGNEGRKGKGARQSEQMPLGAVTHRGSEAATTMHCDVMRCDAMRCDVMRCDVRRGEARPAALRGSIPHQL